MDEINDDMGAKARICIKAAGTVRFWQSSWEWEHVGE